MIRFFAVAALLFLLCAGAARALPTNVYGTTVRDVNNQLLSGSYTVTLKIYNAATGGTAVWTQSFGGVSFVGGAFDINGTEIPTMYFDAGYYMALVVSNTGISEMTPRCYLDSSKTSKRTGDIIVDITVW